MVKGVQGSPELQKYFNENPQNGLRGTDGRSTIYYIHNGKWEADEYSKLKYEIVSFEEYLATFDQKQQKMQTITKDDLVRLLSVSSCSEWKATIQNYLQSATYELGSYEVKINHKDLVRLNVGGDEKQKDAVAALGIKLREDKNLFNNKGYNNDLSLELSRATNNSIFLLGASFPKDRPELYGRALLIKGKIEAESIYLPNSCQTILVINQA